MRKILLIFTILFTFIELQAQWTQIGNDIDGDEEYKSTGRSISINIDGSIVAIGDPYDANNGHATGAVRVYQYQNGNGNWNQIGSTLTGQWENSHFGSSVSLNSDGYIIAVGSPTIENINNNDIVSGNVRVFKLQNGWQQIGNPIYGESSLDYSGSNVSLNSDGSRVAIGAPGNDGNGEDAGHIRIYKNENGDWVQIGNDIDGEAAYDQSGIVTISSDGSKVAIGALFNDDNGSDSGHVRIYEDQNGNWTQIGNDIDGENAGDNSGHISFSGNGSVVAIGAKLNDGNGMDSGHVRVYENQNGNWTQIGDDIDGEETGDFSGIVSLSSNGSRVAIGAQFNDGNDMDSGHVRIYENQNGNWLQLGNDIDGEASEDNSGYVSLNFDGSIVAIGAPGNDGNGEDSGHVRLFSDDFLGTTETIISNVSFYPNPTKGAITLDNSNINVEKLIITDILGKIIIEKKVVENEIFVDLSNFSSGIYFFHLLSEMEKMIIKVIKN